MKILEIMTTDLIVTSPDATLRDAAAAMLRHNIGALPVCRDGALVGIVTDRDIVARSTAVGGHPETQTVGEVMSERVVHVFADQDVQEAAWLMEIKRIRRLAVVGLDLRLIGMVSLADLALQGGRQLGAEVLEHLSDPRSADRYTQAGPEDPRAGWTFSRL